MTSLLKGHRKTAKYTTPVGIPSSRAGCCIIFCDKPLLSSSPRHPSPASTAYSESDRRLKIPQTDFLYIFSHLSKNRLEDTDSFGSSLLRTEKSTTASHYATSSSRVESASSRHNCSPHHTLRLRLSPPILRHYTSILVPLNDSAPCPLPTALSRPSRTNRLWLNQASTPHVSGCLPLSLVCVVPALCQADIRSCSGQ